MKVLAVRYPHFVRTNRYLKIDTVRELESGEYGLHAVDTGAWRDRALRNKPGIEFRDIEQANRFMLHFGGEYAERRVESLKGPEPQEPNKFDFETRDEYNAARDKWVAEFDEWCE